MTTAGRDARITLKVTVGDTWQPLMMDVAPDDTVNAVKLRALADQRIPAEQAVYYEVKLGGALIRDESESVKAAGAR